MNDFHSSTSGRNDRQMPARIGWCVAATIRLLPPRVANAAYMVYCDSPHALGGRCLPDTKGVSRHGPATHCEGPLPFLKKYPEFRFVLDQMCYVRPFVDFGHNAQMPQILKLAGMKSYWFQRGVPDTGAPSEFLWQGIDGAPN
jgi:hypothetical protein